MSALEQFCGWLAATPISQFIQITPWAVPVIQTVHILALSIVFFIMVVFDLQVIGILAKPGGPDWSRRALIWLWWGLAVLLASGTLLIIGEPERELTSWPFRIKMALVVLAALLTMLIARMAARSPTPLTARLLALLTLLCWVLIIVAGRWIAYINFGPEEGF